jgi:hypothetical protein
MVFCFSSLLVALAVAAAPPAVEVHGRVVDENGVMVAGVEVSLRAVDGETHATYTDEAGRFTLVVGAAGEARISLSKPGYFRLADHALQLGEGVNEVSLTLSHEFEVHEKVEVTSSPDRVEPRETAHQDTLVAHEVRDIPVPSTHVLASSLVALPGVLRDNEGQLHIAGARSGDSLYALDGFEVGDPATGQFSARVNVDTVRAVQVESARYGAQYAHAGAGVLALDTAVGDDRWRFGTTNFLPDLNVARGVHFGNWYPRATFSGPLRKGRAWFSDAASVQHTLHIFTSLPRGADTLTQWAGDNLLRFQLNLTPGHILQGSFLYNQTNLEHVGLGPFTPLSTTTDFAARRYFVSLRDQIWWQGTLLEIGVAGDAGRNTDSPQGSQPYLLTPAGASGNFFEAFRARQRRWQWLGKASLPSRQWHGAHDLAIGFDAADLRYSRAAARTAIEILRSDGTLVQSSTFTGTSQFGVTDTRVGAFAQDSWRLARPLVVQVGVRADWDRRIGDTLVAPRIAVNFLPFRDDRAKLALAWGRYSQPVDLTLFGQALDQQQVDKVFDATGTIPVLGPVASSFALPAGGLKQPYFDSASVEWVQRIGGRTFGGVHLTDRRQRRGLAYADQLPGQPGGVFLLQDTRSDTYRAAEVRLRHSFSEKTEVFGSYTRSRARSNQVLEESLGALLFAPQAPGPLAWDAPNRLLLWGWAPAPLWHLLFSYFFEYRTGFPFSVVDQRRQLVGPPNRLRFHDYASLNLALEKRFAFRGHVWAARLAVVNVTGHENPNSVVNHLDAPDFLRFAGGQGRAFTARLRLVGRK